MKTLPKGMGALAELGVVELGVVPGTYLVVRQAHAILVLYPPGTKPTGAAKNQVEALKNQLDAYNNPSCTEVPVIPGN